MSLSTAIKSLALIAVAAGMLAAAPVRAAETPAPSEVWSDAEGAVSDAYEMRAETGFYLGEDRARYRERLQRLLDEAARILSTSAVSDERSRLTEIRQEIKAKRGEIEDMRVKMARAPEAKEGGLLDSLLEALKGVVRPTKQDYADRIAATEQEIADLRTESEEVQRAFAQGLREMGIDITDKQAEGMLSMATADELADILSIFQNMRGINDQLMEATVRSDESLEVARRYYGLHTTMLEVALFAHEVFVERVDDYYLARLEKIEREARGLRKEARELVGKTRDGDLREILRKNLESHELTLKAARIYERRLQQQRASIQEARRKLAERVQVARNTWRTVKVSAELVAMLQSTDKAFETLMDLDLPDLRPFQSMELKQEFDRLTEEIEGAPTS